MKKFIHSVILFGIAVLGISLIMIIVNTIMVRKTSYDFDPRISTVVIGDSNSQCSINDTILKGTINLSESAAPYFYSYLKLKKILASESNIDTIVLSIAPHNIFDNGWLFDEQIIYANFGRYFPLMEKEDFMVLLRGNPVGTIGAFRAIPVSIVAGLKRKVFHEEIDALGGYINLDRDILEDQVMKLHNGEPLDFFRIPESFEISREEVIYLKKIEQLCRQNQKELLLIYLPKREELLAHKKYGVSEFYAFYQQTLSSIPMIDYSQLSLPEDSFADLVHLNKDGAAWFSSALRDYGYEHVGSSSPLPYSGE